MSDRLIEKYSGSDLKFVDADTILDHGECLWVARELDKIIGHITAQIEDARVDAKEHGDPIDPYWLSSAKKALKNTKIKKQAVQARAGVLKREARDCHQKAMERAFMNSAMAVLTKEQIRQVWDHVHASSPTPQE